MNKKTDIDRLKILPLFNTKMQQYKTNILTLFRLHRIRAWAFVSCIKDGHSVKWFSVHNFFVCEPILFAFKTKIKLEIRMLNLNHLSHLPWDLQHTDGQMDQQTNPAYNIQTDRWTNGQTDIARSTQNQKDKPNMPPWFLLCQEKKIV